MHTYSYWTSRQLGVLKRNPANVNNICSRACVRAPVGYPCNFPLCLPRPFPSPLFHFCNSIVFLFVFLFLLYVYILAPPQVRTEKKSREVKQMFVVGNDRKGSSCFVLQLKKLLYIKKTRI